MVEFLLNAIAALIGALTAGAIGYFFAVRRFHHERAFEHRLAWHERTVHKLTEASAALQRVATCMQIPKLEDDLSDEFENVLETLPSIEALVEAEMYASKKSCEAMKEARRDQSELTVALVQILNTGVALGQHDVAERISPKILEDVAKSMLHGAYRLASDVRETLRLGHLDEEDRLYSDQHVASVLAHGGLSALDRAKRIREHGDRP